MVAEIDLYNSRFDFVRSVYPMDEFVLTYGIEEEKGVKRSFLVFYDKSKF